MADIVQNEWQFKPWECYKDMGICLRVSVVVVGLMMVVVGMVSNDMTCRVCAAASP